MVMPSFRAIGKTIGTVVGLAITVFVVVFLLRIKSKLDAAELAKDTADVARLKGEVSELKASLALRDSVALKTNTIFLTAKASAQRNPVVTGGGPKADSIANAAVGSCFEAATNALTACQQARATADSMPILRDSIFDLEKKLLNPKRWTAYGGLYYTLPDKSVLARVESKFKVFSLLGVDAGIEHSFSKILPDSLRTRYYIGGTIPFR